MRFHSVEPSQPPGDLRASIASAPTVGQAARFQDLRRQLDAVLAQLAEATGPKLAAFNEAAARAGAAPVLAPK